VQKHVKHTKKKTLAKMCNGIKINDSYASIARRGYAFRLGDIMCKHDYDSNDFLFSNPHAVICIGNAAPEDAGEEQFLNLTTVWNSLNLGLGLRTGWQNTMCRDGTGKLSKKQVTMALMGIVSIPARYNVLNYCIGPVENEVIFFQAWKGVEALWY
jgi:hypothetical protein